MWNKPYFFISFQNNFLNNNTVGWGTKAQCFCPPYLKTWFFYVVFNAELNGTIRILCFHWAIIDLLWLYMAQNADGMPNISQCRRHWKCKFWGILRSKSPKIGQKHILIGMFSWNFIFAYSYICKTFQMKR